MQGVVNRRELLKRAAAIGVAGVLGAGVLSACQTPATPTAEPAKTVATEPTVPPADTAATAAPPTVNPKDLACDGMPMGSQEIGGTIEVWSWWITNGLETLLPEFQRLYPNVKVNFTEIPINQLNEKTSVAVAAGTGTPDVCSFEDTWTQIMIGKGALLDLSETVGACMKDFAPYKVPICKGPDGKIYAIPWDMAPVGLYYRQDLWQEKGFEVPETWDQYVEQGIEFAKDKHYMTEMSKGWGVGLFDTLLWQAGGSYFGADGTVTVDSDKGVKALTMLKKMLDAGIMTDIDRWTPGWFAGWKEGTLITNWGAAWMAHVFDDNIKTGDPTHGQWRIAPLPAFEPGGARSACVGGAQIVVFKNTQNPAAAAAFVKYVAASLEGQVAGSLAGNMSAYLPALLDPRVKGNTRPVFGDQQYYPLFVELAKEIPLEFRQTQALGESQVAVNEGVLAVYEGRMGPEEALKAAADKVREIVKKYS